VTAIQIEGENTGKVCPYCRFPLKAGTNAEKCDECGTIHHAECWVDGGGCSVFGCPNFGSATQPMPAAPAPERRTIAVDPAGGAPTSAVAEAAQRGSGNRMMWIVVGVAVFIGIAGVAAAFVALTQNGSSSRGDAGHVTTIVTTTESPVTTENRFTGTEPVTTTRTRPTAAQLERRTAASLARIVDYSVRGRDAVRAGRYDEAISNRRATLRYLDALRPNTARVRAAKNTLTQAMEASLQSDLAYASGGDASYYDAEATRLKRIFIGQWNPIAARYGLSQYSAGDV
jgi:Prokaryotic RING finger family 1